MGNYLGMVLQFTFVNCLSACQLRDKGCAYPPCNWLDMSPEMLTLVAEVLAYDMALEMWDRLSSMVEVDEDALTACLRCSAAGLSLNDRSWTRLEKDIVGFNCCSSMDRGRLATCMFLIYKTCWQRCVSQFGARKKISGGVMLEIIWSISCGKQAYSGLCYP